MMRQVLGPHPLGLLLIAAVTAAPGAVARAAGDSEIEQPRTQRSRQILLHVDGVPDDHSWFRSQVQMVSFDKKAGLEYTRPARWGQRDIRLSVRGPVVGNKRGFGLGFEIRF